MNEDALSAIGVSVPIYLLFVSVILGLVIGITILLAQFFGAKQFGQIKSLISTMSVFLLVLGLAMAFIGAIFAKPLLQVTQTPAELLEPATAYLRMVFLGIPFSMLYNMLGAVMRSFGETKMPLYALVVSSIITLSEQRYTRSVKNQFHPLLRCFHSVYVQYTSIKRLAGIEIAFFPTLRL